MQTTQALSDFDPNVLAAANINPETGLATDYLNHFNEVAMLIGMVSDMPDVLEEITDWQPLAYADHFMTGGFRDKELAVAAYDAAPDAVRMAFDSACTDVEFAIMDVQMRLQNGVPDGFDAADEAAALYTLISLAGGLVNGAEVEDLDTADQASIDALFD